MHFILTIFLLVMSQTVWAACPAFDASISKSTNEFLSRVESVSKTPAKPKIKKEPAAKPKDEPEEVTAAATAKEETKKALSTPSVLKYKERYSRDFKIPPDSNKNYMEMAKVDARTKRQDVLYLDVENSVQKNLNDNVFGEKTMVDSVNNAFMEKFYHNMQNSPLLSSRISGQYKDYKSLRFRLELKPGDKSADLERAFTQTYQATTKEFQTEFDKLKLHALVKPRTDDVPDVDRWFLGGSGENPIAANMAARGARKNMDKGVLHYADHIEELHKDVLLIENLRKGLSSEPHLMQMGVIEKLSGGQIIPSKDMIGILRKYKRSAYTDDEKYLEAVREKVKQIFGKDISDENIMNLTNYFSKVDSLSPPMFSAERVEINLGEANHGIVSIDFTGVGVDNAYQQMSALAKLNYSQTDKAIMMKEAFGRVGSQVNLVTKQMQKSKDYFEDAVKKVGNETHAPMFSGDDGIFMPKFGEWASESKKKLITELGKSEDPSKFRITFVKSHYANGKSIPAETLSSNIVKAEKFEKAIREKLIGVNRINTEEAKKVITAIDFIPSEKGGVFKVIVGGKKLTEKEQQLINDIAKKSIDSSAGETFAGLEVVSVN